MGDLTAQRRGQAHHHRLGDDQPAGDIQYLAHRFGAHFQPLENLARAAQATGGDDEGGRQRLPLDMPLAAGALVVLDHGVEHQAVLFTHDLGGGQHKFRADRVALLRHRR